MKQHHEAPKWVHLVLWLSASLLAMVLAAEITIWVYNSFNQNVSDAGPSVAQSKIG